MHAALLVKTVHLLSLRPLLSMNEGLRIIGFIYPLKLIGIYQSYPFDQSVFVLRVVVAIFHFCPNVNSKFHQQTVETDQTP